jgi:hypothetical protein
VEELLLQVVDWEVVGGQNAQQPQEVGWGVLGEQNAQPRPEEQVLEEPQSLPKTVQ